MQASPTDRDAVISAANVLMVALLKMNRVIIPVLLKYSRARRMQWIQNAERDVLNHVHNEEVYDVESAVMKQSSSARKVRKQLISGVDVNVRGADWHTETTPLRSQPKPADSTPPSASASASAVQMDDDDDHDHIPPQPPVLPALQPPEESTYDARASLKERIKKEEDWRRSHIQPFVYTSVVSTTFTIFTIFFYSLLIITSVLLLFPFQKAQAIVFAFSLIATATISEAETLLRKTKSSKPEADASNTRPKITHTDGKAGGPPTAPTSALPKIVPGPGGEFLPSPSVGGPQSPGAGVLAQQPSYLGVGAGFAAAPPQGTVIVQQVQPAQASASVDHFSDVE